MARCGECQETFEGNRQPTCPFCGAVRPRPRVRVPPPPEPTAVAVAAQVVVDHTLEHRRKRKREREMVPVQRPRLEALNEAVRMLDLEFAFGGPVEDIVIPILEFEEIQERTEEPMAAGDEHNAGIARLNAALGRFKRRR